MRKYFLVISILYWHTSKVFSQTNFTDCSGYVIHNNNDSFFTRIRIDNRVKNIEFSNLYYSVIYIAKNNKPDTLLANDSTIVGFGFKKDSVQYNFHRLKLNKQKNQPLDKNLIFGWCIVDGPVKFYSYAYDVTLEHFSWTKSLYQNINPNALLHVYSKNKTLKYFFQKNNQPLQQVKENSDGSPDKKWLLSFFKDDQALTERIGKEINIFDLEAMVKEYNQWYKNTQTQK